jgi:signal transduction histidine kinase
VKIRIRLTLWYFSISLIVLFVFSLGTYFGMRELLFQALDKELNILASTIERSYDPFFDEFSELSLFHENVNRYLEYYLIVYNKNGTPVYSSPLTSYLTFEVPVIRDEIVHGFTISRTLEEKIPFIKSDPDSEITFRIICRQLFYKGNRTGWITIGLSIEPIKHSMENLLDVLIGAVFGGILLVGFSSYFLTRKALHPINIITTKANQISQDNLDERISVPVENDELGQLSSVLNNLLDRLHQAFSAQQQFLADAAHELKTPLSVLRAHWESEINNPKLSLDIKEKLVQDIETITRLTHLINNLLLLAQTEAVRSRFEYKKVELDKILNDVLADAKILAEMKSQKIDIVDWQPIEIVGDRMRLYQLYFNIMDNAVKYAPESAKISIMLCQEENWALVEIRDNGVGISQEHLPHIFDRFFRVQKDRARKTGGSGLGLAISLLIARSHGGNIEVESEIGKGSLFRIRLPLKTVYGAMCK